MPRAAERAPRRRTVTPAARAQELRRPEHWPGYHLLPATRGDLLRRLGRNDAAAREYRVARELAGTGAVRRYLDRRLAQVTSS